MEPPTFGPPTRIIAYTLGMMILAVTAFIVLLSLLPEPKADAIEELSGNQTLRRIFLITIGVMFISGMIGGALFSIRGLAQFRPNEPYDKRYNLAYYLSPISGGICGLVIFFLLLGGALTLNIGADGVGSSWATFTGRMPYIAFALLAGFGSQKFMQKVKEVADTLFANAN
jgi:hypothetical protein